MTSKDGWEIWEEQERQKNKRDTGNNWHVEPEQCDDSEFNTINSKRVSREEALAVYNSTLTEGTRYDEGKEPYHLLAPELLESVSRVLDWGQRKYAPRNWEKGMHWSRVFGSLMRHMWKWWRGENIDNETGLSHLAHAGANIMFLIAYEQRKVGTDDRPSRSN